MDSRELKRNTVSSLFWKLLERGGSSAVSLVVQIVMARLLAPEQFGMLAIILVFVNIGNIIVQSGMSTSLIQAEHITFDDYDSVFWLSTAVAVLMYGICFIVAPVIADFYSTPELTYPLRVLTLVLIVNAYNSIQVAHVSRELQFRKVFISSLTAVITSGAVGISVALLGYGIWSLVAQQLAYQCVTCIALSLQIPWRPRFFFSRECALTHFSFGWKLLASGLLDTGYQSLADLIIGKQFTVPELGLVSQGGKYPQALTSALNGSIQVVMLSAVARVQNDVAYVKRLARRALKTTSFIIVPCMVAFAVTARPLVMMLLGEQWLPCVPFMQMYCAICALIPIHTTNLQVLNGMGRSDLFLKLEVIKKLCGISILLVCVFALHDIYWIVGGYIILGVIATFINAHPNKRVINYSYVEQIHDVLPSFAIAIVSGAIALPIGTVALPPIILVFIQVSIVFGIYLILARVFHMETFEYLAATVKDMILNR